MSDLVPDSPPPADAKRPRRLAKHFRWQALFQQTADPLFLLDRRRRLLFVNRAWEALTGVPAAEAGALTCRQPRPAAPGDSWKEILEHALTPPAEAIHGSPARVRRLLPARSAERGARSTEEAESSALRAPSSEFRAGEGRQWWEVEFLPLRQEGQSGGFFLLGRIRVLEAESPGTHPLPERLANLRQRAVGRHSLEPWAASTMPAVRRLVEQVRLAAGVRVPVLLVGEPGCGKQTLARVIHYQGPARERPFIALDCRRLPPAALASALFGEWAAPGGAGAFYLQEPACLPRDLQLRLLALLAGDRPTGPRLLAGACRPPEEEVRAGRLLEDLAWALGTLVLAVPPLRERLADLPLLVEGMLARANADAEVKVMGLTPDAWEVVRAYPWPGNLRELYRALSAAQGRAHGERIAAVDLPASVRQAVRLAQTAGRVADRPLPLDKILQEAERRLIELALRRTKGHQTKAAQLLGIWRQRLQRRMEVLGFQTARGEPPAEEESRKGEE